MPNLDPPPLQKQKVINKEITLVFVILIISFFLAFRLYYRYYDMKVQRVTLLILDKY